MSPNRNGGDPLRSGKQQHPFGGGRKAGPPPWPLDPRLPPSRRHPEGLLRCQRWEIDDGEQWQCSKAARRGFRVCGVHGAGYPARERRGEAKNPKLSGLVDGQYAKPDTMAMIFETRPDLRALFLQEMNGDGLLDLRPQLAMAKVLAHYFVEKATPEDTDKSFGKTPPVLAAIDALNRVMQIAERFVSIEEKLGPITHAELNQFARAVAQTVFRFVADERQAEAYEYLRRQTLRQEVQCGGETEAESHDRHGFLRA